MSGRVRLAAAAALLAARAALAQQAVTIDGAPPLPAIWQPAGEARAPALVLLHGCAGLMTQDGTLRPFFADYARRFRAAGWHVLLPDSFAARNRREVCTEAERSVTVAMRREDVRRALAWLAARPDVDPARIALVGWSHGASTVLAALAAQPAPPPAAAVAFYPGCPGRRAAPAPGVPLLMLLAEQDDWTPPAPCLALAEDWRAQGAAVEVRVYADSVHGFDAAAPVRQRFDVPRRGGGVRVGGNPAARQAALAALDEFLQRWLR
ncbi:MAG: dienelactone hydrolase family protein [Burkholderiaceae bacterium]|nr:dienelactone hydrolase family protein [Burkholderiaceae bacterium]